MGEVSLVPVRKGLLSGHRIFDIIGVPCIQYTKNRVRGGHAPPTAKRIAKRRGNMKEICLRAYGKINLGIDIVGRRPDGYHEVDMILQTVDLYDWLTLRISRKPGIRLKTNAAYLPCDENNLVYRAIAMLQSEFQIREGVEGYLHKFLPVAAGMGGGSSDAAAALEGMNRLFGLGLTQKQLQERGLRLGADVPFCVAGGTWHAGGIGEKLTRLPAPPACSVVVVKPPVSVSTRYVYENLKIETRGPYPHVNMAGVRAGLAAGNLEQIAGSLGNILEEVTIPAFPVIAQIKSVLEEEGALRALMSGSGPTVFGIFRTEAQAMAACARLMPENRVYRTRFCEKTVE